MSDDIGELIDILDWSKFEGELKPKMLDVVEKVRKFVFALRLTNKFTVAKKFAGIGNAEMFFPYWFGQDGWLKIKEYARNNVDMLKLLEKSYSNYLIECEEIRTNGSEEEEHEDVFIHVPKEEPDKFVVDKSLTFKNVISNIEVHTALAMLDNSPEFDSGIYWVISFVQRNIDGFQRPFLMLARVTEDKELCYIQGAWPLTYLENFMMKNFPLGYVTNLRDLKFIEIEKHRENDMEIYDKLIVLEE